MIIRKFLLSQMKFISIAVEFPGGKNSRLSSYRNVMLPILTLLLLTAIPLYIYDSTSPVSPLKSLEIIANGSMLLLQRNHSFSLPPLQPAAAASSTNDSATLLQSLEMSNITNGSIIISTDPLNRKNSSSSPLPLLQSSATTSTNDSTTVLQTSPETYITNDTSTSISVPLDQGNSSSSSLLQPSRIAANINSTRSRKENSTGVDLISSESIRLRTESAGSCNIFKGNWVPTSKGPYYTNATKCVIDDRQNCMKFGRPDTGFLRWRWRPYKCELSLFDAVQFLELVRGKTLAFVGDSVGRNQMQSLVCLLASAADPVDVSYTPDTRFRRWLYTDYNFTIVALWSPLLVKVQETDSQNYIMDLHVDEADDAWTAQIESADMVIISAGQWFFRPFIYYQKGKAVGCYLCNRNDTKDLSPYYGYRMAFRTAFRALTSLKNFKGLTFLRTFSPAHFENGEWNNGGSCGRRRPFTRKEMKLDGYNLEFYKTQVKEFRVAERRGRKKGLKMRLLDATEAMVLRPDGHPNHYGHWPDRSNKTPADCVHWCLPGPVDTWNEFLLQMLKMEKNS